MSTAPSDSRAVGQQWESGKELVMALVVHTRKPFYQSRTGRLICRSTLLVAGLTLVLPYLPVADLLGLVPLPAPLLITLLLITALYVTGAEVAKRFFYAKAAPTVASR